MTRLPREKEPGKTPQGVLTTEEACRFPRRKASYFLYIPAPTKEADLNLLRLGNESIQKFVIKFIKTIHLRPMKAL